MTVFGLKENGGKEKIASCNFLSHIWLPRKIRRKWKQEKILAKISSTNLSSISMTEIKSQLDFPFCFLSPFPFFPSLSLQPNAAYRAQEARSIEFNYNFINFSKFSKPIKQGWGIPGVDAFHGLLYGRKKKRYICRYQNAFTGYVYIIKVCSLNCPNTVHYRSRNLAAITKCRVKYKCLYIVVASSTYIVIQNT